MLLTRAIPGIALAPVVQPETAIGSVINTDVSLSPMSVASRCQNYQLATSKLGKTMSRSVEVPVACLCGNTT